MWLFIVCFLLFLHLLCFFLTSALYRPHLLFPHILPFTCSPSLPPCSTPPPPPPGRSSPPQKDLAKPSLSPSFLPTTFAAPSSSCPLTSALSLSPSSLSSSPLFTSATSPLAPALSLHPRPPPASSSLFTAPFLRPAPGPIRASQGSILFAPYWGCVACAESWRWSSGSGRDWFAALGSWDFKLATLPAERSSIHS